MGSLAASSAVLLLLGCPRASAQGIQVADDATLPRFDVASVKPGDPNVDIRSIGSPPGRFYLHDMELFSAVNFAFPGLDISNMPDLAQARFTIEAKMPDGSAANELPLMIRALLVDRFKLRYHVEQREEEGYALTLARRDGRFGPQLRRSPLDCASRLAALRAKQDVPPLPAGAAECGVRNGRGVISFGGMPMSTFVRMLSNQTRVPVVDETTLAGSFDVDLRFALGSGGPPTVDAAPPAADPPSIFTAIEEQLGLKLTPRKSVVQRIVIDHIERPEAD